MTLVPTPTPADDAFTSRGIGTNNTTQFLNNMYTDLQPTYNAVTKILNKISLVNIIRSPRVENPFTRYMGTTMPFGQYIENLAIGDTKPEKFDPTSCTRGFFGTDIVSWFGEINDDVIYKKSVSDTEIRPGVHDSIGMANIASGIIDSLLGWVQNDMVTKFEKQFARVSTGPTDLSGYTGGYETIAITDGSTARTDEEIALDIGNSVIYYVNEFKGMRSKYNKLGKPMTVGDGFRPDVLMPRHVYVAMRKALAQTYHLEPYDIDANIVLVDSFATPPEGVGGQIGALVIDPRVLLYHQQDFNTESERCSTGRSTLYSTHLRGAFNFLWGYNAVAITMGETAKPYTATPVTFPKA